VRAPDTARAAGPRDAERDPQPERLGRRLGRIDRRVVPRSQDETAAARIEPGAAFGSWTVLRADATGKRISVICSCGEARVVAADALLSGESRGCGCTATPRSSARRPDSRASAIAAAEQFVAAGRHRGRS